MPSVDRPTVRAMRPDDAATVVALARELATHVGDPRPALRESDLVRDSSGPERWFDCLVVEIAGGIVGYATASKAFEAHTGKRRLWLGDLYVRPAARGKGAGRALVAALARRALALDCDALHWELWRINATGAAFYRKLMAEEAADLAVMRLGAERLAAIAADKASPKSW
jgi:GNAT superfamily N-acetyltransferase